MTDDTDFTPRLGRSRGRQGPLAKRFVSRALAATNRARGAGATGPARRGFSGARIGRGAGAGRVLGSRSRGARRVIVKTRIVRLAGKGRDAAIAHLKYIQRDGTTRDGAPGRLYGRDGDAIDGKDWLKGHDGDRHQFRFIVAPEDGDQYEDLKPLTRALMARMASDLQTELDWVAADHHDTGHPHTHIVLRGVDERGADLLIARDYLTHGLRARACELVELDLGPATTREIEARLRAEIDAERLTSIDRSLIREGGDIGFVDAGYRDPSRAALRSGRLEVLGRMGLATRIGGNSWRLPPDLAATLKRMGERGDIVRTMQRAHGAKMRAIAAADMVIDAPAGAAARLLVGRVLERGLANEIDDRHYLVVEGVDGRSHYVAIGRGEATERTPPGAIVGIVPNVAELRPADRTVAAVAAANAGRYSVDLHLTHDRTATEDFAAAHVRRLEAMRRGGAGVMREPDGSWTIAPDHLDRVLTYERGRVRAQPVTVEVLSPLPLPKLIDLEAATWLDRDLGSSSPILARDAGFGADLIDARARRRQWLVAQGLAFEQGGAAIYPPDMLATLQARDVRRAGAQMSARLGLRFDETSAGQTVQGICRRPVDLASGRFALIENQRAFSLVPWRPVLERAIGREVVGRVAKGGGISWTLGRARSGPEIGSL